jgi:uncharacterized protein YigE (DUF2233 family)
MNFTPNPAVRATVTLLILASFWAWSAASPAAPAADPGWIQIERGLEYREVRLGFSSAQSIFQLRCDPALTRLGLINAADYRQKSLKVEELAARSHCWAAVNGGYFDGDDKAMGYQRDWKRVLSNVTRSAGLFGGVFVVGPRGPELLGREDFTPGSYSFAMQCGPRLIYKGDYVKGIHTDRPTRRTGIGVDRKGRIFLYATGVAAHFTFAQTQAWLCGPSTQGGLQAWGVLNLDGGSSTQMSVQARKVTQEIVGWAGVPVAIGVFPRP